GGLATLEQVDEVLSAGAAKVSISSAAVKNPDLLPEVVGRFGGERLVLAVDAKRRDTAAAAWEVYINGGSTPTGLDLLTWVAQAEQAGVGEILLTSIDTDGTQDGYDYAMLRAVSEHVKIPVIASGGAGQLEHFRDAVQKGKAAAVLAASLFHFKTYSIREVKEYLAAAGIPVRLK
ncbi:MAG: imidazole glycerol phosphate synthase cyclase subunit, partial [Firmicutes bacterium]|nr:imidazole glycerol phosphate synthase cyclase subunit [Bacillota bacterium]